MIQWALARICTCLVPALCSAGGYQTGRAADQACVNRPLLSAAARTLLWSLDGGAKRA